MGRREFTLKVSAI